MKIYFVAIESLSRRVIFCFFEILLNFNVFASSPIVYIKLSQYIYLQRILYTLLVLAFYTVTYRKVRACTLIFKKPISVD